MGNRERAGKWLLSVLLWVWTGTLYFFIEVVWKTSLRTLENTFLNRAEMGRKNGSSPITAAPICYVRL